MESEEKIKEVHEGLSGHAESLKQQTEMIKTMHTEVSNLKTNFSSMHSDNAAHLMQLKQEVDELRDAKEQVLGELNELKLLKTHIKQKLVDELTKEFKEELQSQTERIKTDVKSYNDMKQSLQSITLRLEQVKGEMDKFNSIAKNIKEKDFSLERHAKQLKNFSDEKHELLKKIDALERLVGRERRRK